MQNGDFKNTIFYKIIIIILPHDIIINYYHFYDTIINNLISLFNK